MVPGNPHTKFFDGFNREHVRCTVTLEIRHTDYRIVETIGASTAYQMD
ncbi:MAG: hypothetical protein AAGF93_05490 [Cyanobacteria bacterium P01_H01_bin.105]